MKWEDVLVFISNFENLLFTDLLVFSRFANSQFTFPKFTIWKVQNNFLIHNMILSKNQNIEENIKNNLFLLGSTIGSENRRL